MKIAGLQERETRYWRSLGADEWLFYTLNVSIGIEKIKANVISKRQTVKRLLSSLVLRLTVRLLFVVFLFL